MTEGRLWGGVVGGAMGVRGLLRLVPHSGRAVRHLFGAVRLRAELYLKACVGTSSYPARAG